MREVCSLDVYILSLFLFCYVGLLARCLLIYLGFLRQVTLCNLGSPKLDLQARLTQIYRDLSDFASHVLGSKACTTSTWWHFV